MSEGDQQEQPKFGGKRALYLFGPSGLATLVSVAAVYGLPRNDSQTDVLAEKVRQVQTDYVDMSVSLTVALTEINRKLDKILDSLAETRENVAGLKASKQ